jgi:hypothetical protein
LIRTNHDRDSSHSASSLGLQRLLHKRERHKSCFLQASWRKCRAIT